MKKRYKKFYAPLFILLTAGLLAMSGCGGAETGGSNAPAASTLSGVAAVGSPIANGTINVICTQGSAIAPTTTNGSGAWSVTLTDQTFPCAVRVTGGTVNGAANTTPYHSIATSAGTVNVTPLTDLMVANLVGTATPRIWFIGLSVSPTQLTNITQTKVDTALTNLRSALSGLTQLSTVNPITTPFSPTPGNISDDILTGLSLAMNNTGVTYASLLSNASAPGFTSPGVSFNTALTQSYESLSRGVITFEPRDLYVFPEGLGTILNPSISAVQVGKAYISWTPSNCAYGAFVAKQGSPATVFDALTTWNVSDTTVGWVTSQPALTDASASLLGPLLRIVDYGTTSVSIFSPALNVTGYFNIHSIIPGLFPAEGFDITAIPPKTLTVGSIILGANVNEGMDLSPWNVSSSNTDVVTVNKLGECGELKLSSNVAGHATITAVAQGPNGDVTVGPLSVCVDNIDHTFCNPPAPTPAPAPAPAPTNPFSGTTWAGTFTVTAGSVTEPQLATDVCTWAGAIDSLGNLVFSSYSCAPLTGATVMTVAPDGSIQSFLFDSQVSSIGFTCTTSGNASLSPKSINYSSSCSDGNVLITGAFVGN